MFNTPFHWIGMKNYRAIYNEIGTEPNAGQIAIIMLLNYEVEELFITGFSFYAQGDLPSLSHRPGHTNKGLENEPVGEAGHKQIEQLAYFVNKILNLYKKQIRIDSYLYEVIKQNYEKIRGQ